MGELAISGPTLCTVGSVGARGEVRVDFDDGSWVALATPMEHAWLALRPEVQKAMPRAASTAASGVEAASGAVVTHGVGEGPDPTRVHSKTLTASCRKRGKGRSG